MPGWELKEGPILEKSITPMRSFVAAPMRSGRLSQLRYVTTSQAAATTLAENYCGYRPLRGGLLS